MSSTNVIQAIDTTWKKFRAFVLDSMRAMKVPEAQLEQLGNLMKFDALAYLPNIRQFVKTHEKMILAREKNYFRALIPEEWKHLEIPDKIADKGLDFGKVFILIIKQLEE